MTWINILDLSLMITFFTSAAFAAIGLASLIAGIIERD